MTEDNSTSPKSVEQLLEKGAAPAPEVGAEEKKVGKEEAPAPRTYSEEEWSKRQSSWDTTQAKVSEESKKQLTEAQTQLTTVRETARQAEEKAFLQAAEDGGQDIDIAKAMLQRERTISKRETDAETQRLTNERERLILEEAGKAKSAHDLVAQYELGEKAVETLLSSDSFVEMENKALKLKLDKAKIEGKLATVTDSSTTQKASGIDRDKMSIEERLQAAMDGKI